MPGPRPNIHAFAKRTKQAARRQRIARIAKHAGAALLLLVVLVAAYLWPRPMRLPAPHRPVVVHTSTNWYKAYVDEAGQFRHADTGLPINQVVYWSNP